jgi:RimJ/RimL family protein N-acetyltransferase
MSPDPRLETERLILRPLDGARDFEPLAAMMADEQTARFIGGVQERAAAWRSMCAIIGHWQVRGYGFFAVEDKATGEFLGRVGPWYPEGWPAPEVGWTIRRDAWGKGYASEAATAAIDWAFDHLKWSAVIHVIEPANTPSIGVAIRLGSVRTGHIDRLPPFGFAADLYGQSAADWRARRTQARQQPE